MNDLICADAFDLDWGETLQGRKIDLLMLDPPYNTTGLAFDGGFDVAALCVRLGPYLSKAAWVFCWGPLSTASGLLGMYVHKFEYIWRKTSMTPETRRILRPLYMHDICWAFRRPGTARPYFDRNTLRTAGKAYSDHRTRTRHSEYGNAGKHRTVFTSNIDNWGYREGGTVLVAQDKGRMARDERTGHPTQKPLAIYEPIFRAYCPPGGLVVDPCSGSSTTLLAALNTDRDCVCIEKDPKYVSMSTGRLRRMPAPQPVLKEPTARQITLDAA